jgi:peptidoglycan/xylan/chitin deacetylase (PgdA/CDA1 family)
LGHSRLTRIRHGDRTAPAVALTFDDGPGPDTERILDALARLEAPATFFFVGSRVAGREGIVARIRAEGHEIGSHSWTHGRLADRPASGWLELVRTSVALWRAGGVAPHYFRPPYAEWSVRLGRAARLARMQMVTWDVDPRDWQSLDPDVITERVLDGARPGSIVLLHEGNGAASVRALPAIVTGLRERALEPVTLSTLLRDSGRTSATGPA